jgi:cation:H+ antiporter
MSDRPAAGMPNGAMAVLAMPLLVSIFVVAVGIIWVAGVQLSEQTDVLATRLHLGSALGDLILLAVATNLPEIATSGCRACSSAPRSWRRRPRCRRSRPA